MMMTQANVVSDEGQGRWSAVRETSANANSNAVGACGFQLLISSIPIGIHDRADLCLEISILLSHLSRCWKTSDFWFLIFLLSLQPLFLFHRSAMWQ